MAVRRISTKAHNLVYRLPQGRVEVLRARSDLRGGSELNCQSTRKLIHPYLDRELNRTQAAEVERHLEECNECDLSYRGQIALRFPLHDASLHFRAPAHLKGRITSLLQKSEPTIHDADPTAVTCDRKSEIIWARRLRARAKRDITVPKGI
jgi:putative zinc finger protein